jgi:hypothetical protein
MAMNMNLISAVAFSLLAFASFAAGPGGGGMPPGGGGNQPGGNQPGGGSSGTWTFDTFLASSTTTSGLIIREGIIIGYASPTSPSVASSVTDIVEGALAGCTTLTSIDLSATSITSIPANAFSGCTVLSKVVLPASCTVICENAFAGCTALATLTATGVATVGDDAFRGCTALASIPSSVTTLGDYAFAQSGVTEVDVSGIALGEGAFAGCESLSSATVGTTLPDAVFAGCTALDQSDWSGVTTFGQAALADIPATALTLSPSATLGEYALAADEATTVTTLANSSLPTFADTALLGREVSYTPVAGSVARIEASDLVEWLIVDSVAASPTVTQPADYNTATLKTWLETGDNAYAYAYADELAEDDDFEGLTVSGSGFVFNAPANDSLAISVEPVACYELSSDERDWDSGNLVWSEDDGAYVAADDGQTSCFARLRFTYDW